MAGHSIMKILFHQIFRSGKRSQKCLIIPNKYKLCWMKMKGF